MYLDALAIWNILVIILINNCGFISIERSFFDI
jgi:hypothetical protein